MSGSTFPSGVTITQSGLVPLAIAGGNLSPPPPGVPPYPLSTDPTQVFWLVYQNGALTWIEQPTTPLSSLLALEDAAGFFLLEDGAGDILLEN
jgi:hypothetical protein